MSSKIPSLRLLISLAALAMWLLPAEAAAATPLAAPTNLQVTTYWSNGSAVVEYSWVDHSNDEWSFEIEEYQGDWGPVTRGAANNEGTGPVTGAWFHWYPDTESLPVTVCGKMRATFWTDRGWQYSEYSNRACSEFA